MRAVVMYAGRVAGANVIKGGGYDENTVRRI